MDVDVRTCVWLCVIVWMCEFDRVYMRLSVRETDKERHRHTRAYDEEGAVAVANGIHIVVAIAVSHLIITLRHFLKTNHQQTPPKQINKFLLLTLPNIT